MGRIVQCLPSRAAWPATATALAVAAFLGGCSGPSEPEAAPSGKTTLERVVAAGSARIGYANEAPYAYHDSAKDRVTGEAPEIARVILADIGIRGVEAVLTEFGSLIPGLNAKRFDIIAAGMYILPERCKQVTFSNPTYSIGEGFVVKAGNPRNLHSYEDVAKNPDATLGVVAGTVERTYARAVGIPDDRVIVFPSAPSALAGVQAERVDAFGGTSLTIQNLVDKSTSGDVERAHPFTDPVIDGKSVRGYGAFAFRKSDKDFIDAFNMRLGKFIGTERHLDLVRPFGFTRNELPGEVTAVQACRG